MEEEGKTGELFDRTPYMNTEVGARKAPVSEAEKRLQQVRDMEDRDFKNLRNKLNSGRPLTKGEAERLDGYKRALETAAGKNLPANMVRTAKEVAEFFGRHIRTIRNWTGRGMPQQPDCYDLEAIEKWAATQGLISESKFRAPAFAGPGGDDSETVSLKDRRAQLEVEIKELDHEKKQLELDVARGKYVTVEEINASDRAKVTAVKRALLAIPRAMAPQLVGLEAREIEALLMDRMRDVCMRFAQGTS